MGTIQSIAICMYEISKRKAKDDDTEYKLLIDNTSSSSKKENDTFKTNKKLSLINDKK